MFWKVLELPKLEGLRKTQAMPHAALHHFPLCRRCVDLLGFDSVLFGFDSV
jgi:hypothetical protein